MEGMDSGMSSNESDDDIDEDEDLGVDMDGYPSDDDIDGEIEDEDAEAVDQFGQYLVLSQAQDTDSDRFLRRLRPPMLALCQLRE